MSEGVRDKWMHIAHIYTGSNVQVYVNAIRRSDWFKDDIDTGNYFPLQFGRWTEEDNQLGYTFKGLLDDFRVYDDWLNASDILKIYGNGSGDLQVVPTLDIPSVVDGSPVVGRIHFKRNGLPVEVENFDISSDLTISQGTIDSSSLVNEGNGTYRFNFNLLQENQVSTITLASGKVNDRYGEGNQQASVSTRLMYRAVTRGQDLLAWWPFDEDAVGSGNVIGKTSNARTANLYDGAVVSSFGKFGNGVRFDRTRTGSRMTVDDGKTVGLGNNWTFSAWVKNQLPPMSNLRSTLFRGHYTQGGRDYDRFIVVRGSDRMLCFFDGDDRNGNNRYRSTGYEINPLNFSGWHHFAATAGGSRTNFYIDGKFVGDADRREQSTVKFIGNSSSNELFAEYLDDVRIYGVSLSFSEIAAVYGGGFGDQYQVFYSEKIQRETRIQGLFEF